MAFSPEQPKGRPKSIGGNIHQDVLDSTCENHSVKRVREDRDILEERPITRSQSPVAEKNPVEYWAREGSWPQRYFDVDPDTDMAQLLARSWTRSPSPISHERSGSNSAGSTTPSDQRPRDEKAAPYRDPRYRTLLETKGTFMHKSERDIAEASVQFCQTLLDTPQTYPLDSLFRDDIFETTCRKVADRSEARLLRDITPLIVPSAEVLATYGASALNCLIESINEGWNNSNPLTGSRPQPDYAVGFRRDAFSKDRLNKLSLFIGDFLAGDQSFYGYDLEIAGRQNAHSMTLAVRGVVELFRVVKRKSEVDRQILAFSISHNHQYEKGTATHGLLGPVPL
ncbi:hypothetical protein VP1G_03733 [Cytospora mali]|uniref:DUF7924 domain-containing protein n=1 Tax=Cytospora mali TaxID=578113 RepID=A0A194UXK1_CYTMA|nr:hypothetical protein VP1G_03733 [Valsa mali var. pyri (nom. inval.)]